MRFDPFKTLHYLPNISRNILMYVVVSKETLWDPNTYHSVLTGFVIRACWCMHPMRGGLGLPVRGVEAGCDLSCLY